MERASFHTRRMKANWSGRFTVPSAALAAVSLLASCASPPPTPAPAPVAPAPTSPPPGPVAVTPEWRDAPVTPGNWRWTRTAQGSTASFGQGQFVIACNPAQQAVTLWRASPAASGPLQIAITTTQGTRTLGAIPAAGGISATVAAADPMLDAMAFSRGRFAVSGTGTQALYMPSWAEISRVVEDCR